MLGRRLFLFAKLACIWSCIFTLTGLWGQGSFASVLLTPTEITKPSFRDVRSPKRLDVPEVPSYLRERHSILAYCKQLIRAGRDQLLEAKTLSCNQNGAHWSELKVREPVRIKACIEASGVAIDRLSDVDAGGNLHRKTYPSVLARDADLMLCRKAQGKSRPKYKKNIVFSLFDKNLNAPFNSTTEVADSKPSFNFSVQLGREKRKKPNFFQFCRRYGHKAVTEVRRARDEYNCPKQPFLDPDDMNLWSSNVDLQTVLCLQADNPKAYIKRAMQKRRDELNACIDQSHHRSYCFDFADKMKGFSRYARRSSCSDVANHWRESKSELVNECVRNPQLAKEKLFMFETAVKKCIRRRGGSNNPGEDFAKGIIGGIFGLINNQINKDNSKNHSSGNTPPPEPEVLCNDGKVAFQGRCIIPVPSVSRDVVRKDQVCLNVLGFNAGAADGLRGRMTRAAVRRFLTSYGLFVQDNLYSSARERLYKACDKKLAEIKSIKQAIDQVSHDRALDNNQNKNSDTDNSNAPSGEDDLLSCLKFDDWNVYIQKKIKPPLPLCKGN